MWENETGGECDKSNRNEKSIKNFDGDERDRDISGRSVDASTVLKLVVDWIHLAQGRDRKRTSVKMITNFRSQHGHPTPTASPQEELQTSY
jgi:hypothetical protein